MDPRTAAPSSSGVVEVSVLAEDCATADGLATGIFVLGAEAGIALLDSLPEVEGLIVTEQEGEIGVHLSRGLEAAPVP
jgi:thiamine biosynthesis lipoprotein